MISKISIKLEEINEENMNKEFYNIEG